jgi:crotonobetainyl-CoA:carnitine CoA-transferase CaiB-like acyl-CoA transferase
MRFRYAPLAFDRPPPLLGEHNEEVRTEFAAATRGEESTAG